MEPPPSSLSALCSLDDSGPAISIQTELALEQLKQKHEEELQQLNIQLETQVSHTHTHTSHTHTVCSLQTVTLAPPPPPQMNYYERSLEKMRQSMEVERKDISQAFKVRKVSH